MKLAEILAELSPDASSHRIMMPKNWSQGRTCYGGLSATLAYQAAKLSGEDMPPLKSAQIAFAGPLAGEVEITATTLRRGRNTAFVRSDIRTGPKDARETGLSCSFIFMKRRESHVAHSEVDMPDFPPLPKDDELRSGPPEYFSGNMQYAGKRLQLGQDSSLLSGWQRLIDREGLDPIAELLCMGDALPPSVMGLMTEKGMVSSMNWQTNLLTDTPATKDGWWYLTSETHHAANGASSQYMSVWNADGEPVMTGMQSVALFV
ncbi:MAG: thioesterase family protein [Sphingorhabdus sp.]